MDNTGSQSSSNPQISIRNGVNIRSKVGIPTNNVAEYEAILLGLQKLKALSVQRVVLLSDSQVVSDHISGNASAKQETLQKYLQEIRRIEHSFERFTVKKIPRADNEEADALAKAASQEVHCL